MNREKERSDDKMNPAVLMGISGTPAPSTETMYELWGHDPVHPNEKAYKLMADRIIEETGSSTVVHPRKPTTPGNNAPQTSRERWTTSTPTVANRRGKWADYHSAARPHDKRERGRYGGSVLHPRRGGYRGRFRAHAPWAPLLMFFVYNKCLDKKRSIVLFL